MAVESVEGESIVVTPSGGTSVSVGSVESQSISISSTSAEINILEANRPEISVSTSPPSLQVSTTTVLGEAKRLRDLKDVVGTPTSGQVLVYNQGENNFQFADQQGGGAGGSDVDEQTDYAIEVTNTDEAFSTINGFTYEKFTSITDILNDILNPYTRTTVTFTSMSGTLDGGSITQGSGTKVIEVGRLLSLNSVSYSVGDPDKVKDNSTKLTRNGNDYQTLPKAANQDDIDPVISAQNNTPTTDKYKITIVDNGNSNGQEVDITSGGINFSWRYRVSLFADGDIPSDNTTASALFVGDAADSDLINDPGSNSFDLTCDENNAEDGKYTFLFIPKAFGTLKSVLQNNSTDTTSDFVLEGEFTVTNEFSVNIPYYIYRTNDTGAYNDGVVLTVTLN